MPLDLSVDTLKEKAGPLPVWAWGAIIGGGVIVFIWWKNRGTATVTTTDALSTWAAGVDTGSTYAEDTTATVEEDSGWTSPDQWLAQAVLFLAGTGVDSLQAQIALQKYMDGQTLTQAEAALVSKVLSSLGLPPFGIYGIPSVDQGGSTVSPSVSTPVTTHYSKVTSTASAPASTSSLAQAGAAVSKAAQAILGIGAKVSAAVASTPTTGASVGATVVPKASASTTEPTKIGARVGKSGAEAIKAKAAEVIAQAKKLATKSTQSKKVV